MKYACAFLFDMTGLKPLDLEEVAMGTNWFKVIFIDNQVHVVLALKVKLLISYWPTLYFFAMVGKAESC